MVFDVIAIVDPLTREAQKMAQLLIVRQYYSLLCILYVFIIWLYTTFITFILKFIIFSGLFCSTIKCLLLMILYNISNRWSYFNVENEMLELCLGCDGNTRVNS